MRFNGQVKLTVGEKRQQPCDAGTVWPCDIH